MGRTLTVKSAILFRPISIMAIKFFWNEVWDALNAETTRSLYLIQLKRLGGELNGECLKLRQTESI